MWDSDKLLSISRRTVLILCALSVGISSASAAEEEFDPSTDPVEQALNAMEGSSNVLEKTASTRAPLEGKTEHTEIILEDTILYKQAMKSMAKKDYSDALRYLQLLTPKFDVGQEPLKAQVKFYEAECHQNLKRMRAAMDTYKEAYDLFAKYDSSNPLKGKAIEQYQVLKVQQARMGSGSPLEASVQSNTLQGAAKKQNVAFVPRKGQYDINPNALLEVHEDNKAVLLRVKESEVLPKIVKECFSDMTCLETAEIGSNVTNADRRWTPLKLAGETAALAINGVKNPAFRATVNGRSYRFDIVLPGLKPGMRKVLVVTDSEKICAVDVDTMDTWLLRMTRAKDGRLLTARWYKLDHKKDRTFAPPVATRKKAAPPKNNRIW